MCSLTHRTCLRTTPGNCEKSLKRQASRHLANAIKSLRKRSMPKFWDPLRVRTRYEKQQPYFAWRSSNSGEENFYKVSHAPALAEIFVTRTLTRAVRTETTNLSLVGSPIILVFETIWHYKIPRGTPSTGALSTREYEKINNLR